MPRPKIDDWRAASPKTPLQRSAFLDACSIFLTREPNDDDVDTDTFRNDHRTSPPPLAQTASRTCEVCGNTSSTLARRRVNPYAQAEYVIVCESCG